MRVPTPVGPLGPEEIDPNDPDYWDWDAEAPLRLERSPWIRITAVVAVIALVLFVIAAYSH
jgi:hypothetical protein